MLLFGRLYITNQLREGDSDVFFLHTKNQLQLSSLSDVSNIKLEKKNGSWINYIGKDDFLMKRGVKLTFIILLEN